MRRTCPASSSSSAFPTSLCNGCDAGLAGPLDHRRQAAQFGKGDSSHLRRVRGRALAQRDPALESPLVDGRSVRVCAVGTCRCTSVALPSSPLLPHSSFAGRRRMKLPTSGDSPARPMPSSRRHSRLIIQRIASFNISSRTAASSPARCSQLGALGMRPTAKSVIRVFVLLNLLAIVAFGVNWALGSNYMFLSRPPVTQSPFFFAPWPWYIPILDGVALVLFCLLLLPFKIGHRVDSS